MSISKQWGSQFAAWLRQDEVFVILNPQDDTDETYCDWQAGGCRLLAESLLNPLQNTFPRIRFRLQTIVARGFPQHVVVTALLPDKSLFIDGEGVSTRSQLLDRWAEEIHEQCQIWEYDADQLNLHGILNPPLKQQRLTNLLHQTNLQTFEPYPISSKVASLLKTYTEVGAKLNADQIWACDVGAVFLAYLADEFQIQRAITTGVYRHPTGASYSRATGQQLQFRRDYPVDEQHTWIVLTDQSGKWLIDPNGEVRGEPRAQRLINQRYQPFEPGHDQDVSQLLKEAWDVRLTEAIRIMQDDHSIRTSTTPAWPSSTASLP